MSDKSLFEQQADLLMENVSGWERSTLARIGKRISKYGKMSLADIKTINNITAVNQDFEDIIKELAKATGYNISQIYRMYSALLEEQHLENKPLYDYRNKPFVPFSENIELQALARAYAKATGETMINLAKTKALSVLDRNGNVKGLKRYYTDILDKAVMQISSGATDFRTAMRDTIVELGGSGIRINYGGGVTRRLDTAVRQNLLWGAKQASVAYNELIGEELDCDGYEIDWHSNPRPSHAFMQGKQYCIGESRTVDGVKFIGFEEVDPDPINEEGKSASEALEEYGCLHFKTPIICGVSEPRHSPEELKRLNERNARTFNINGKEMTGYEASQAMRRLETEVRKQKDIRTIARESGDVEQVRRCNARIKACKAKYAEISEITGISQEPKRMSVPRMPKTDGNHLTNAGNGGIIKETNVVIDNFTPCLVDRKTGEIVKTTYSVASAKELSALKGWKFNWNHPDLRNSDIYKLSLKNGGEIQGLVALEKFDKDQAVYVNIAESAPHNLGKAKAYDGVGGHLFAIAAQKSKDFGYGGFFFLDAKNIDLVEHYKNLLGATHIGGVHPYRMIIDEEAAENILSIYNSEEIK